MSRKSPRPPSKVYTTTCEQCEKQFVAFRSNAKYCSPKCRLDAFTTRTDRGGRQSALEKYGFECVKCENPEEGVKLFTRFDPERGEKVPLCGLHNSEMSRTMFYKRVPNPERGYARRVYLERKEAKEQESVPTVNPL